MRYPALLLLVAASAAAQTPGLEAPPLRPLHDSVPLAYLASAGATVVLVGAGLGLDAVLPDAPDGASAELELLYEAGTILAIGGVLLGPAVGNLTLGASDEVARAFLVKGVGISVGGGLVLAGVLAGLSCLSTGPGCAQGGLTVPLVYGGAGVAALGVAAGTLYDLASIPGSAARARTGATVRPRGAGLAVTVGL